MASGTLGYVIPLTTITVGYGLFQTANNTSIMAGAGSQRRGVVSALVALARNLGLIIGAWVMGAIFAVDRSALSACQKAVRQDCR